MRQAGAFKRLKTTGIDTALREGIDLAFRTGLDECVRGVVLARISHQLLKNAEPMSSKGAPFEWGHISTFDPMKDQTTVTLSKREEQKDYAWAVGCHAMEIGLALASIPFLASAELGMLTVEELALELAKAGCEVSFKMLSEEFCRAAIDPWAPDPLIATEVTVTPWPALAHPVSWGEPDSGLAKFYRGAVEAEQLCGSLEALRKVVPKMLGAYPTGIQSGWLQVQACDALRFAEWAAEGEERLATSMEEVRQIISPIAAADITTFRQRLSSKGFWPLQVDAFHNQGLTDAQIESMRSALEFGLGFADAEELALELATDHSAERRRNADRWRWVPRAEFPPGTMAVAIVEPREGSHVRGTVNVRAVGWCNDIGAPPAEVGLLIDGQSVAPGLPFLWDTLGFTNGTHALVYQATDTSGQLRIDPIQVTVDNAPPSAAVTSPMEGRTYQLSELPIHVATTVVDNLDPTAQVRCLVLDGQLARDKLWPANGSHTLVVRAIDRAGNETETIVHFNVQISGCTAEGVKDYGPFANPVFDHGHAIGTACDGTSIASPEAGTLVVCGAGKDIWQEGDQCMYAYGLAAGDFSARVRIAERQFVPGSAWGKCGIMARQDCTDRARYSFGLDPGEALESNTQFQGRVTHGGSDNFGMGTSGAYLRADVLRLDRCGNVFIGYVLDELGEFGGTPGEWVEVGRQDWGAAAPPAVLLGLAVTSHHDCDVATIAFKDWQLIRRGIGLPLDPAGLLRGTLSNPGLTVRAVSAAGTTQVASQCDAAALLGGALANDLDATATNAVINFAAAGAVGEIGDDAAFPGLASSPSTDDFAFEATGWLDLPVGTVTLNVSSDDGFALKVGGQRVMTFRGNRGAEVSAVNLVVAHAGLYPYRLTYHNRAGAAELELFQSLPDPCPGCGKALLVNDPTDTRAVRAYQELRATAGPLSISLQAGTITIWWDPSVSGFVLESTSSLPASSWTAVSNVTGNRVTLPNPTATAFYRLRK